MAKKKKSKKMDKPLEGRVYVQKQGNFRLPAGLVARFKVQAIRDRISMRAAIEAMVEAYLKGEFKLEEEKSGPEKGEG